MGTWVKKENRMDIHELKKMGEKHLEEKIAYENQLIDAFNAKKLKSETKIAEAQAIIKMKEKKSAIKNKKNE